MQNVQAIVITGAGSGLGLALTMRLVKAGYKVFAGLRDIADADVLPAGAVALQFDVTDPSQIREAVAEVQKSGMFLKALVNNAGVYSGGPIEFASIASMYRVFEVNFFGALSATQAFLPLFRQQRGGQIHMVSSLSGLLGLPGDGVYAASKHALEAATESLSLEIAPWDIDVVLLELGAFETGLLKKQPRGAAKTPYEGMMPESESSEAAAPVAAAAQEIEGIIKSKPHGLRYPVGPQANHVIGSLKGITQQERRDFILAASGTENWVKKDL